MTLEIRRLLQLLFLLRRSEPYQENEIMVLFRLPLPLLTGAICVSLDLRVLYCRGAQMPYYPGR